MQVTLEVPAYSPETGISYNWVGAYEIKATVEDGAVCIVANKDGLLSLAGHLLNLAQATMPVGHHMHLNEHNALEEGSLELILIRA
jgi:hypothetical protein